MGGRRRNGCIARRDHERSRRRRFSSRPARPHRAASGPRRRFRPSPPPRARLPLQFHPCQGWPCCLMRRVAGERWLGAVGTGAEPDGHNVHHSGRQVKRGATFVHRSASRPADRQAGCGVYVRKLVGFTLFVRQPADFLFVRRRRFHPDKADEPHITNETARGLSAPSQISMKMPPTKPSGGDGAIVGATRLVEAHWQCNCRRTYPTRPCHPAISIAQPIHRAIVLARQLAAHMMLCKHSMPAQP